MKSNINESPLKSYNSIPSYWIQRPYTQLYNTLPESELYSDGWRDIVFPSYNSSTQYLGSLIYDSVNDYVTYEVIDYTEEQLQEITKANLEAERIALIKQKQDEAIMTEYQAITDDNEAIDNQAIYPFWSGDGLDVAPPQKYQAFDGLDVNLYRCIQAHVTQPDWNPPLVPALFTKLEFSGGIEVWSQPTGGDGKYPYLDPNTNQPYRVLHNGFTWENSNVNGLNVWEPGVFGWTQVN